MISNSKTSICCANCVHAKRVFFVWFCTCPVVVSTKRDPVTGRHDWLNLTCRKVRNPGGDCGLEAKLFEVPK